MVNLEQGVEELRRMITETGIRDYSDPQFSNVRLLQENPNLAFGPADDEADPELEQLQSLYRSKQAPSSVQQAAG